MHNTAASGANGQCLESRRLVLTWRRRGGENENAISRTWIKFGEPCFLNKLVKLGRCDSTDMTGKTDMTDTHTHTPFFAPLLKGVSKIGSF